ncbi:MAG: MaoC family dehydratase N-terminal domain-containing protein [Chloroflexi bacterium]|nr:MaoC family dehydratase N-terminal domain-containing protein [Chloroflexota bacterium]
MSSQTLPAITGLPVGWAFPVMDVDLSAEAVHRYIEAVGRGSAVRDPEGGEVVPPAGLVALCLGACLRAVKLPEGTLHISQDIEVLGPVRVGERLALRATIEERNDRAGVTLVSVDFSARDERGREWLRGKATLLVPLRKEGP